MPTDLTLPSQLQTVVAFEVREVDAEQRVFEGTAVPYDEPWQIAPGLYEEVAPGALEADEPVQVFYSHDWRTGGLPVGRVESYRDANGGLQVRARISRTPKGDEVYTLLRDGVINKLSIGFDPRDVETRTVDGEEVFRVTRAVWRELSVAINPAYPTAGITRVREREDPTMPADTVTSDQLTELREAHARELAELREANSDLERRLSILADSDRDAAPLASQWRSFGEFVRAVASGDEAATTAYADMMTRDFATTDDTVARAAWVNRALRLVEENRRLAAFFNREPLPPEGLSVDYPQVAANTVDVDEQAAEGDDLTYGELQIASASADVKTYGGYVSMSRQVIERSSVPYLTTAFRAMAIAYAKRINAAVRAAFVAATTPTVEATFTEWDAADYLGFIVDAAGLIEDAGLSLDGLIASEDVFKHAATLLDGDGRPVFNLTRGGGQAVNVPGSMQPTRFGGTIDGLPIFVDRTLAAGSLAGASREALTTWESPGAPFRLQDSNVINLTQDFSVYGYAAISVEFPAGIVKRVDAA